MKHHRVVTLYEGNYNPKVEWAELFAGVDGEPLSNPGDGWFMVEGEFDGADVLIEESSDGELWAEKMRFTTNRIADRVTCANHVRPRVVGGGIHTNVNVIWVESLA